MKFLQACPTRGFGYVARSWNGAADYWAEVTVLMLPSTIGANESDAAFDPKTERQSYDR